MGFATSEESWDRMSVAVVRTLAEQDWRRFVEQQPSGNIFHTPEMFQVFAHAKSHRPELWAAIDDDRVLALLLPVRITLMGGWLRCLTTRSVVYGSVLCAPETMGQQALGQLLDTYGRQPGRKTLFTEMRHLSDMSTVLPVLEDRGFACQDHLNFLIDVSSPVAQVWDNVHKSARRKIRKALERGRLEIEVVSHRSQVAACYDLFAATYKNAHIPLADLSLFESAFDVLSPRGMVQFWLGTIDGASAVAAGVLLHKDTVYGWYLGFERAFSKDLPNDLMIWHILEWAAQNGYRVYDFGGAGKPGEDYGPRQFKAKFGGALVNFGRSTCIHHPHLLGLSRWGYKALRRFV